MGTYIGYRAQSQTPVVELTQSPDKNATTTFTMQISDVNGAAYVATAELSLYGIGEVPTGLSSGLQCDIVYDRALNQMTLLGLQGEANVSWVIGASGNQPVTQGNCQIDTAHTTVTVSGNTIALA